MLTWPDLILPPINLYNVPKQFYIKGFDMEDNYVTIHKSELEAFQAHDRLLKALFESGLAANIIYVEAIKLLREQEVMEHMLKE